MHKFPVHFREAAPADKLAAERQRIYDAVTKGADFDLPFETKLLMSELHKCFPTTFQMWKESTSGLDEAPTGKYSWVTIDREELAPEYRISCETRFRVKGMGPKQM